MPLAVFALVIRRWQPSRLVHSDYQSYQQLAEYLPEEVFNARMERLQLLIRKEFPNIHPDSYMFSVAILLVIITAVFSIIARGLEISMWYPLLILLAPGLLAYWTTRRRSMHYLKMSQFQDSLHTCLKDMTAQDISRQVKWDYRRLRESDTAHDLHLNKPISSWTISLIVEASQVDPEIDFRSELGEALPTYEAVTRDVVLDIGPARQDLPGDSRPSDGIDLADCHTIEPPPYSGTRGTTVSPPAYDNILNANNTGRNIH